MFPINDITVTKHVIRRLRERFRAKFYRYVYNEELSHNLILAQVANGTFLNDWKRIPFYVNKISSLYGMNTEIVTKSGVYYICKMDGKKLIVKTCVTNIMGYGREPKPTL